MERFQEGARRGSPSGSESDEKTSSSLISPGRCEVWVEEEGGEAGEVV